MSWVLWAFLACAQRGDPPAEPTGTAPRDTGDPPASPSPDPGPPLPGTIRPIAAADAVILGDSPGDLLGDNATAAGDLGGDGRADLWIGAKGANGTAGAAYAVPGAVAGTRTASEAGAAFAGEVAGDYAGGGLAGPGDVDGDGTADLLVGAKRSDRASEGAGAAWLLRGPALEGGALAGAHATFTGERAGDEAGGSLSGAGDLDGDGTADLLIGATAADPGGSVYVVTGAPRGLRGLGEFTRIDGLAAGDNCGGDLAALGDIDGDGRGDFAIGAGGTDPLGVNAAGEILVFTHLPTGVVTVASADARVHGTEPLQVAGAVAGPGDLDGDGHRDLAVGAPGDAGGGFLAGGAFVLTGPIGGDIALSSAVARLEGAAGQAAGFALDGPGDLDGDGAPDLLIGGPGTGEEPGTTWWVPGATAGRHALADVGGALVGVAGDRNGHAVAGVGDTNGDGWNDLISGAYAAGGGAVYLVLGGPGPI